MKILKLTLVSFILIALVLCFSGCGNRSIGIGSYTFEHIHFSDAISGHCGTVEKWYDSETGIEVKTIEHGPIFLSEGSYIMFNDGEKCPYCN